MEYREANVDNRILDNTYMKVVWRHSCVEDPVVLWSEISADRFEVRKVDLYSDGRLDYAGDNVSTGITMLGTDVVPALSEIGADPEFEPASVDKIEFEAIWNAAVRSFR